MFSTPILSRQIFVTQADHLSLKCLAIFLLFPFLLRNCKCINSRQFKHVVSTSTVMRGLDNYVFFKFEQFLLFFNVITLKSFYNASFSLPSEMHHLIHIRFSSQITMKNDLEDVRFSMFYQGIEFIEFETVHNWSRSVKSFKVCLFDISYSGHILL